MVYSQQQPQGAPPTGQAPPPPRRPIPWRLILWLVVLGLALWFIFANTQHAQVKLWTRSVSAPIWLVLLITLIVGMFLGWLATVRRARTRRR